MVRDRLDSTPAGKTSHVVNVFQTSLLIIWENSGIFQERRHHVWSLPFRNKPQRRLCHWFFGEKDGVVVAAQQPVSCAASPAR